MIEYYSVDEMLKFQLRNEQGVLIVHSGTNKAYYAYELAEIYHQQKGAENVANNTKSAKPFTRGHRHKIFASKEIEKIENLKSQGISNRKIAKMFNCDEKTIRNYLRSAAS